MLEIVSVSVKHEDRGVGMMIEADVVRKVIAANRIPEQTPASVVMSSPLIGIEDDRPIREVADLMHQAGTRHLTATKSNEMIGMISVWDLLRPVAVDAL